ncbi:MAG: (d)CMP kinase [Planctomycetota bacterium]|nr:MAG: (d)CMP kinase [Planctomycetota bacterium]
MIVTIDGPAGSGKSTAARGLAQRLQFDFLDTGAMYRAVAWQCMQRSIDLHDETAVAACTHAIPLRLEQQHVFVDDRDVTAEVRHPDVSCGSSIVASNPAVRRELAARQREFASGRNVVTEGRDQGTAVFPNAECKFYVTANAEERAARRHRELLERHEEAESLDDILRQIRERDARDKTRVVDPLRAAEDAIRVDTSGLTSEAVLDRLETLVRERMLRAKP